MSENYPEVDGDDSDLKECLLEALRSDGTLKQIQDQLSTAVYAAFYQRTTQTPIQTQSKLTFLTSKQNGLDALSLLVDFLQTLELKKTLSVLMHETGLDGFKFERREDLIRQYNVQSISENAPILPILLDSVANQLVDPSKLHKAVVLDQVSDNENLNPDNGRILEIHDINHSHFPDSFSNDLHNQNQSPPQHSIASPTRSGALESGRSLNDRDSYYENRQSQLKSQKSSSPIPLSDKNVLSADAPSVSLPVSNAPTQNVMNKFTGVDRIFQPQTHQGDNESYHSAGPVVSPTYHRYIDDRVGPISPPHNHSLHNEITYKSSPQVQKDVGDYESGGSDIDSEITGGRLCQQRFVFKRR